MRVLLRILSPLLGLAVAGIGGLVALETAVAWLRPDASPLLVPWPSWRARLANLTWVDTSVRLVAAALALTGLVLLLVALTARRREVWLTAPAPEVTVTTSPRSLARLIGHLVRSVEDVTSASVTASARKVSVRTTSRSAGPEADAELAAQVQELLSNLPLARQPKVSVALTRTEELA